MKTLLDKTYDGESITDFSRDFRECFDEYYNPEIADVPTDEHGFMKGQFRVTVQWVPE